MVCGARYGHHGCPNAGRHHVKPWAPIHRAASRRRWRLIRQRPGLLVLDNLETPWDLEPERRATEGTLAALAVTPGLALLARFFSWPCGPAWALVYPVDQFMPPFDNELFCRIAQASRITGSYIDAQTKLEIPPSCFSKALSPRFSPM
jgi:hypothetical protein